MNIDANGERDEDGAIRDGNLSESKISYQAGDLKVSGSAIEVDKGAADRQQRPQNTVEHWDRFLHLRSIRVLLVENDGSTRHIVTALLRNCNYEVIEAANGLQAWKILEDLTNHIDVVLTEVVMPCVSGIALLRKIKSHKTRKIIPVIMMSSHDSMGLVFNCLSKGAIDFLVKPIRKNELKNLWQHVWRRCHSSSGSGSESGTQTQKSVKSKVSQKADNIGSDDGQNNGSNGLNVGDGSDDGNGAQSSWTKQAVEVESSRSLSPIDQVADCPDSTCAQVIHPNAENSGNRGLYTAVPREAHEQKQPDTVAKGKDLEKTISKNMESKSEIPLTLTGANLKSSSDVDCHMSIKQVDKGQLNLTGECLYNKQKDASAVIYAPLVDVKESESTREVASILEINNNATDEYKDPNFELSLKRLRGFQGTGASDQDDRLVSRRFEQSAFSRYNASSNIFNAPNGIAQSSSIIGNSVERESATDIQAHSTEHLVYQSSNEVSNNIDMGSTTNNLRGRSSIMKVNSETTSTVNGLHRSSFKHVKNVANGPMDGDLMNYNLNRSASGSNHGSSTAINTLGTNTKSNFEQTSGSGSGDASGSGSGTGVDENKRAQREAALIKFRQKKKDRSFMKKVRYQTRKSLAEQRPRVRGQFVKQIRTDSSSRSEDG